MASFHPGRSSLAAHRLGRSATPAGTFDEMFAPMLAGAYARGIAETLDMLALPGLLLDGAGEVLFASRATVPLLRGPLRLRMNHLVAEHAEDNRALAAFIADAVGEDDTADGMRLAGAGLELRRLPRTAASAMPGQVVRAVILLADSGNPRHVAMLQLLAGAAVTDR